MTQTTTLPPLSGVAEKRLGGRWIEDWRPEDTGFWERGGKRVAWRNLVFSVLSEHIGFSVWSLWSVLVLFMGPAYGFSAPQKFVITATPALVGSILRVPYTFAVATFGGRNWTIISALLLLIPTIYIAVVLQPGVSYGTVLVGAMLAGVGGANFASSMTNINSYFPSRLKGRALGINAGAGNLGVAVVQLVGLLVLAVSGAGHPRVMVGIYMPLIVVSAVLSALFMDNLLKNSNAKGAMREVVRHSETWVVSLLYIGTFGSFIGFGFAFGQVLLVQFPQDFPVPVKAAALTFLGPLLGSFVRPLGGALADRLKGSVVTALNFAAMAIGALVVLLASRTHSLPLFIVGFVLLFVLSGLGNGSVYKMIPAIFNAKARLATHGEADVEPQALLAGRRSGALIGLAGAIGGLGGVLVNLAFRQSFLTLKNGDGAYVAFVAFYALCLVVTWVVFIRPRPSRLEGV
ncbi:nitrate/nitrite transporter [Microlunatus flavus]|uniref:MFS transporter, NNP family, nitrate/nitrite transporter n=1 Tax=Microlunatus flavus TaxID=1036181 RepID=A0A1H9F9T0_9ACTN|nr:nitrate/nitrite transporter [Microlunatus flavus]SEQ34710.1 MFS transporter, NNP family, nitrate/nitrite transporter [Microlunatus flavus]